MPHWQLFLHWLTSEPEKSCSTKIPLTPRSIQLRSERKRQTELRQGYVTTSCWARSQLGGLGLGLGRRPRAGFSQQEETGRDCNSVQFPDTITLTTPCREVKWFRAAVVGGDCMLRVWSVIELSIKRVHAYAQRKNKRHCRFANDKQPVDSLETQHTHSSTCILASQVLSMVELWVFGFFH